MSAFLTRRSLAALTLMAITFLPFRSFARDWSGGDGNDPNWTSNRNWDGLGGARPGDSLLFPAGAARRTNLNDFPINTSFYKLNFRANGYVLNGNQIFLEEGVLVYIPNGSGAISECNLNIVLADDQDWTALDGSVRFNGVVNLNSHTMYVDGDIILNGFINGNGRIFKKGLGNLTISGDANDFGETVISRGSVTVTGDLGEVRLGGGTLFGTGSVSSIGSVCSDCTTGIIAPGVGSGNVGLLRINGLASLNPTTTLAIDMRSASSVDEIRVTGANLDLNNANLSLTLGFTPTVGQQFRIASQIGNGNITGQFAQGTGIVSNSQLFTISYFANSIILTAQGPVGP